MKIILKAHGVSYMFANPCDEDVDSDDDDDNDPNYCGYDEYCPRLECDDYDLDAE